VIAAVLCGVKERNLEMAEESMLLFDTPGPRCTAGVERVVKRRLKSGGLSHLVVASVSGRTALRLARAVGRPGLAVVCVTGPPFWDIYPEYKSPRPEPAVRRQLESLGVTVVSHMLSSFGDTVEYSAARFGQVPASWLVAETLISVGGYGLKTAIEVSLMATDAAAVPPFTEVLAVAGTDRGADTAVVVVSTFAGCFFGLRPERRFQVKEILAMPRSKVWHKTIGFADWPVREREPVRGKEQPESVETRG
jgi:hypothetical protein